MSRFTIRAVSVLLGLAVPTLALADEKSRDDSTAGRLLSGDHRDSEHRDSEHREHRRYHHDHENHRYRYYEAPSQQTSYYTGEANADDTGCVESTDGVDTCPKPPGKPYTHDSWYIRGGLASGYTLFTGEAKSRNSQIQGLTLSADIAIGGTPTPGLVLGGAFMASLLPKPDVTSGDVHGRAKSDFILLLGGPFVDYFPKATEGFHVGLMLGVAFAKPADERSAKYDLLGVGASATVGYDFWVGEQWGFGPAVRLSAAYLGRSDEHYTVPSVQLLLNLTGN